MADRCAAGDRFAQARLDGIGLAIPVLTIGHFGWLTSVPPLGAVLPRLTLGPRRGEPALRRLLCGEAAPASAAVPCGRIFR